MENKLSLTKGLSDLRMKAAQKFNEWMDKQDPEVKKAWEELLVEINSLKVKIAALKDKG